MLDTENQTLKDILIANDVCTEKQLAEVIEEHERTGTPLQELLVDFGLFTKEELLEQIAHSLGTEVYDLSDLEIPEEVIHLISPENAHMLGVLPIQFDGNTLYAAFRSPLNYQTVDELRFILGHDVIVVVAPEEQVEKGIEKYYPADSASAADLLAEIEMQDIGDAEDLSDDEIQTAANDAPIVRFVDAVLYQAIKDKASDIHFEPFEHEFKIRYRVDGALYEMAPPPKNLAIPVISRVKILSGLNISERRRPQDGKIQLKIAGKPIDLRVSTLPTQFGESVVLRILDRSVVNLDLDVLGINEDVLEKIRDMITRPNGIFIVTGPTGSGKTTTLYSALKEINKVEDKIVPIDGEIEIRLNRNVRGKKIFIVQSTCPPVLLLGFPHS